jgi:hypothetical protein
MLHRNIWNFYNPADGVIATAGHGPTLHPYVLRRK